MTQHEDPGDEMDPVQLRAFLNERRKGVPTPMNRVWMSSRAKPTEDDEQDDEEDDEQDVSHEQASALE